jgi:hypothetical protein
MCSNTEEEVLMLRLTVKMKEACQIPIGFRRGYC